MHTNPTQPPQLPKDTRLYDEVMDYICPVLCSTRFDATMAEVADLPAEQQKERLDAYDWAFQVFEAVLDDMTKHLAADAREKKTKMQAAMHAQEQFDRTSDVSAAEQKLNSINDVL